MQLATTCRGKARLIASLAPVFALISALMLLAPTAKPARAQSDPDKANTLFKGSRRVW